jgi:GNAT superfamily N-acetyltransferase
LITAEAGAQVLPLVAVENGRPLARALVLQVKPITGPSEGYIAFFECLEDSPQAAPAILAAAERWLTAAKIHHVQAPRLDNLLMGLVIKGFDLPQTVLTPHNPSYYPALLESAGYHPIQRMVAYTFNRRQAGKFNLTLPGLRTRCFDRSRLDEEIQVFNTLQNEIFITQPGYVPRTLAEDRALIEGFLPMLDDELVIIAEDGRGKPVGLLVCLPDIYQQYRGLPLDRARLISIGAIPRYVNKGVGVLMVSKLINNLLDKGYQDLEGSWIRVDNAAPQNLAKRFKGRPGREFMLYGKQLAPTAAGRV